MPEETGPAESVTSTDESVTIDPSQLNKPVLPDVTPTGSADSELLKHKLGLANQHAKQAKSEAAEAKAALDALKRELEEEKVARQQSAQKSLEDQGEYKKLWEDAKKTISTRESTIIELEAKLSSVTSERQQDQLKAAALSHINTAGAINSQQMYMLLQPALRQDDEGNPCVLHGGVEQPLGDYLANLKQSQDWQHHFGATGSTGMGMKTGSAVAPGRANPYRDGNLTEAVRLEVENPDLARALKAEAGRKA